MRYVSALQSSTLSTIVPLAASSPVWTVLLERLFLRERRKWGLAAGVLLAVGGVEAIVV